MITKCISSSYNKDSKHDMTSVHQSAVLARIFGVSESERRPVSRFRESTFPAQIVAEMVKTVPGR